MKRIAIISLLSIIPLFILKSGTTGKISGIVTNAQTGERLVGVNVVLVGTALGTATDIDGSFVIVNISPGQYSVRASALGYTSVVETNVRVMIDQTTEINFKISEEAVQGEEVVVVAQRPVVQKDVSATLANIDSKEIESLPVTSISAVVGLQAGVTGGLIVRGGGADQTAFMIDGLTLRNERDNSPYSNISLSSVQDIQVQTGGFNAEYGNIRSGIVNVITKEGSVDRYTVSATVRISPPAAKNFGPSVFDKNSYFIRSRIDPAVAWTGTNNVAWDIYTQRQYAAFDGWNAISQATLKDNDPTNDLTPEAAQQLFLFQFRRQGEIVKPDYDVDAGFGGPFPFVSSELGNLRFFASYRQTQNMYVIPLSKDSYQDYNGQLRITSDVGSGMKLMLQGILGRQTGTNSNNSGAPGLFTTASGIASVLDRVSYIDRRIYSPDYFAPSTITMNSFGGKFTHVLSPTTFYEASLQRQSYKYDTHPGAARDITKKYLFGNSYYTDEFPYGFAESSPGWIYFSNGVGFSNSRDSSQLATYSFKFDFNSQVDRYNEIKSGIEFIYNESNVNYGLVDYFTGNFTQSKWNTTPTRFSLYAQDKFEYEGLIANFGLRFDYSNPGGEWYDVQPFDPKLGLVQNGSTRLDEVVVKTPIKKNLNVSPRLGIAFPVTEYSKLFFNYGHFRSMPQPQNLFLVRVDPRFSTVSYMANPNNPLPKTIAYELGYEHSIFEEYLIRVAGYYKNVSDQSTTISYTDKKGNIYSMSVPNSYEDIRGFEITLSRDRGNWITGFANYTYMVSSSGRFGYSEENEDLNAQKIYERDNKVADLYQIRPIPRPYARASVDFFTPADYGIEYGGVGVFNDWRLNFTGSWQAGSYFTWFGGGAAPPDVRYNAQYRDNYSLDMRLSKTFKFGPANIQLFMDISNLFNIKNFSGYGFYDAADFNNYMKSLHLKSEMYDSRSGYINIPGSDQPGDTRKDGVAFTPIEPVGVVTDLSPSQIQPTAIYWEKNTGKYLQYNGSTWNEVSSSKMSQILDDKSYIDMPNLSSFVFLNPRDIFWGLKVSFEF
ncbi:MAG: TonB-dependent receptor [Bacteroidetes bacterium]|nr:TonB-dependent receptor [Bacteroidota bacterium]